MKVFKEKSSKNFLTNSKLNVLNFFKQLDRFPTLFTHNELLLPILISSCDPNSQVSEPGISITKSLRDKNLEDKQLVEQLFGLFLGTTQKNVPDQKKRVPASHAVRIKILDYYVNQKQLQIIFLQHSNLSSSVFMVQQQQTG